MFLQSSNDLLFRAVLLAVFFAIAPGDVVAQRTSADPRFEPCRTAHAALTARRHLEAIATLEPALPMLRTVVAAEPEFASTLAM